MIVSIFKLYYLTDDELKKDDMYLIDKYSTSRMNCIWICRNKLWLVESGNQGSQYDDPPTEEEFCHVRIVMHRPRF
jgi:hypothetical protein